MNTMVALIRREFWEHRSLWIAPLVVAGLMLASVAFTTKADFEVIPSEVDTLQDISPDARRTLFAVMHWAVSVPQYALMVVVLFFYLLDSLYAERRDRSILFWKSLPVSDAATVLSKALVALVVVPLGVFLVALATDLVASGVMQLRFGNTELGRLLLVWDTGIWLRVQGLMFAGLLVLMLWYAPVAAYLLLVSAWSRRNVFLWAVLPPLLAVMVEKTALHTDYVSGFLGYRLGGVWGKLGVGRGFGEFGRGAAHGETPSVDVILDAIQPLSVLGSVDLWLGVALAAGLLYAAIRVRRHRDEA